MSVSQVQDNYAALHQGFRWSVPEHFNMAEVCCRRWAALADADERIAIHAHQSDGQGPQYTYAQLQDGANRLSAVLKVLGVQRGDRVAIVLPQRYETAVAYMAVLQMGAVGMPLSTLFGPEALEYRLQDSEARVAICDGACVEAINQVRDDCPLLEVVIGVGDNRRRCMWHAKAARMVACLIATLICALMIMFNLCKNSNDCSNCIAFI